MTVVMRRRTSDRDNVCVPHSAGYTCGQLSSLLYTSLFLFCTQYTLDTVCGPQSPAERCEKLGVGADFVGRVTSVTPSHHTPPTTCCDPSGGFSVRHLRLYPLPQQAELVSGSLT